MLSMHALGAHKWRRPVTLEREKIKGLVKQSCWRPAGQRSHVGEWCLWQASHVEQSRPSQENQKTFMIAAGGLTSRGRAADRAQTKIAVVGALDSFVVTRRSTEYLLVLMGSLGRTCDGCEKAESIRCGRMIQVRNGSSDY